MPSREVGNQGGEPRLPEGEYSQVRFYCLFFPFSLFLLRVAFGVSILVLAYVSVIGDFISVVTNKFLNKSGENLFSCFSAVLNGETWRLLLLLSSAK